MTYFARFFNIYNDDCIMIHHFCTCRKKEMLMVEFQNQVREMTVQFLWLIMYISQLKTKFRLYFSSPECLEMKEITNQITLNSFSPEFYFDLLYSVHCTFSFVCLHFSLRINTVNELLIYCCIKWSALQGFLPLRKTLPPHVKNLQ